MGYSDRRKRAVSTLRFTIKGTCAGTRAGAYEASRRLDAIPGVGPVLATALVASIADPKAFRSGRNFSAWIGLVPKQHSSGGKDRFGRISKQGDRYLRSLFMAGALAVIRYARIHGPGIGLGLRHCWRGGRPRSPPSHSPTRWRGWSGP